MKNNQNVIAAIVLSFLVILGWQYLVIGPKLEAERQRIAAEQARVADATPGTVTGSQAPGAAPGAAVPPAPGAPPGVSPDFPGNALAPATMPRATVLAASGRVPIDTPSLKGSINLTGGRIDDLLLADYHVTVEPTSPLVELFSPVGTQNPYYADFGWVASPGGPAVPVADTVWQAKGGSLAPGRDVTLTWDNGAGLIFRRTYSVDEKFMFTVRQSVENTTGAPVTLYPYGLVSRTGLPETAGYYILHEGMIGFLGEAGLHEVDYDELDEAPAITPAKTASGWLGITDKYWGAALVPRGDAPFQPRFLKGAAGLQPTYQADFLGDARRRARRGLGDSRDAALRRSQGDLAVRRVRGKPQHPALRADDRLGLVLFHHQAALQTDRLALSLLRQFRRGDPRRHRHRQGGVLPARQPLLRVDEQDEEAAARNGQAAGAVQGRPHGPPAGHDGALQEGEGQPGGGCWPILIQIRCSSRCTRCCLSPSKCGTRPSSAGSRTFPRPTRRRYSTCSA
jgi:YidC/Oxa1 family membrane protein insertase